MPVYPQQAYADSRDADLPIRTIATSDVLDALSQGVTDFWRHPSHYLFVALIYPVVGIAIAMWSSGAATFPLLYPLATGFALLGPIAALGLYELSRRREAGEDDSAHHALTVLNHPALGSILVVGVWLAMLFALWITAAGAIYEAHFATNPPANLAALIGEAFTTPRGWSLLLWGNLVGLAFALVVLASTAIAFPLLVDRGGTAGRAIAASLQAFRSNPVPMLVWGAMVAAIMLVASIPLFVGLAVALPILGHATWHLYRKLVAQ